MTLLSVALTTMPSPQRELEPLSSAVALYQSHTLHHHHQSQREAARRVTLNLVSPIHRDKFVNTQRMTYAFSPMNPSPPLLIFEKLMVVIGKLPSARFHERCNTFDRRWRATIQVVKKRAHTNYPPMLRIRLFHQFVAAECTFRDNAILFAIAVGLPPNFTGRISCICMPVRDLSAL